MLTYLFKRVPSARFAVSVQSKRRLPTFSGIISTCLIPGSCFCSLAVARLVLSPAQLATPRSRVPLLLLLLLLALLSLSPSPFRRRSSARGLTGEDGNSPSVNAAVEVQWLRHIYVIIYYFDIAGFHQHRCRRAVSLGPQYAARYLVLVGYV